MRVAVIGSRTFNDYDEVKSVLSTLKITLLISGGAKGADSLGEKYAKENNIETKIFYPDWSKHGKKAGFLRNSDIINEAELIIAFWDGHSKGTKDSLDKALKLNKRVLIISIK